MCARLGAPELWWGDSRLPTADTEKCLGLRLESSGGWASQQAPGAANGWAALHRRDTGSAHPAPDYGDNVACPAVSYCAVHVLQDDIVAAIQP